ncbi:MAG: ATP-dependent helicase [Planctomycetes bacterium]|nr:ATP-dependent helicase [Planctomycetota bacterium]
MPSFNLSPSRIARYFHFDCDRFLRYAATPGKARSDEGVPRPAKEGNPVARAILEGGYDWEDRLLDEHLAETADIAPGEGPRRDRAWSVEESLVRLRTAAPGTWVYQPTLRVGRAFRERYGLNDGSLHFPDCRPDLLEIREDGGVRQIRIHDAKASSHQKLSHRVQVTIYALVLDACFEDAGVKDVSVDPVGGVWLSGQENSELFDTGRTRPGIERFLRERVRPLFEATASDAPWHLNVRCEWCDWFDHCRGEALKNRGVSLLPNLSAHARRYLASLDPPVHTLDALGALLSDDGAEAALAGVASLAGQRLRLHKQVNALHKGQGFALGGASVALPRFENVRFILTLQTEPVGGEVYVFGWHRTGGNDLFGEDPRTMIRVAANDSPETLLELRRGLVTSLRERLLAVHHHNQGKDFKDQLSLQCYVFDTYEKTLLIRVLQDLLGDPEVGAAALELFFHFQSPELLEAQSHPDGTSFFPLIVLNKIVRDLVALPIPITYRFTDVNHALQPEEYGSKYKESDFFAFQLSNQLKSDAIFHAWRKERPDLAVAVEDEIGRRLRGTDSIVRGFRERLEKHPESRLVAWAPKFALPSNLGISDPVLSKLAFITRYECVSACLETRERRTRPMGERIAAGSVVPLVFGDDGIFRADPPVDVDWDESFPRYLLSPDTDEGEDAQMAYDDFGTRSSVRGTKGPVALAEVINRSTDGTEYRLSFRPGRGFPPVRPGDRFNLHLRFTDWNTERVLRELVQLDSDPSPCSIARLVTDPRSFGGMLGEKGWTSTLPMEFAEATGFTPSQKTALQAVLDNGLQLIWGPPGTGKTWFLAQTVLALLEAHRAMNRPFRIVVSAFTHTAIDNLLRRIRLAHNKHGLYGEELVIGKAVRDEDPGPGIAPVGRGEAHEWISAHPRAVIGATVWRLQAEFPPDDTSGIDLLVIDEASQVKVAEAAIAIRRLKSDGRLVLAGDHLQLPPIINGTYPDPDPGEPLLHRSVFESIRSADDAGTCSSILLDNFRMCAELCRVPAERLYVPEYGPANETIAAQRLALDPSSIKDRFIARVLEPERPLVVVIIEGVQATGESVFEADRAAECAVALREATDLPDNAAGDREFWREHLFVVTPHHVQRRAVIRALEDKRTWHHPPFVDTVDKMQGQEARAVIVSYGVSDVELALQEREFIYSLNRLNVAITRARMKCVVFLPRPLLEPDLEAFSDDRVSEGIAFIQELPQAADDLIHLDAREAPGP